jgi:hypothetical protein
VRLIEYNKIIISWIHILEQQSNKESIINNNISLIDMKEQKMLNKQQFNKMNILDNKQIQHSSHFGDTLQQYPLYNMPQSTRKLPSKPLMLDYTEPLNNNNNTNNLINNNSNNYNRTNNHHNNNNHNNINNNHHFINANSNNNNNMLSSKSKLIKMKSNNKYNVNNMLNMPINNKQTQQDIKSSLELDNLLSQFDNNKLF